MADPAAGLQPLSRVSKRIRPIPGELPFLGGGMGERHGGELSRRRALGTRPDAAPPDGLTAEPKHCRMRGSYPLFLIVKIPSRPAGPRRRIASGRAPSRRHPAKAGPSVVAICCPSSGQRRPRRGHRRPIRGPAAARMWPGRLPGSGHLRPLVASHRRRRSRSTH